MLERFPAYTYSSLMAEDGELLRLLGVQAANRPVDEGW
jgi:hypothetical protein